MKTFTFQAICIVLLSSFCVSDGMSQSGKDGWEVLFNGKDLTGWRELNGKHKWEVKDGIIIGTDVHNQPNGFLCTEKEYGDFILELEVSIDTLMNNSGIQFRSLSTPEYLNGRVHGYQMELDPKPQRWSGSIYDEGGRRGWLYTTELNPAGKTAFKNNQWNTFRIECFGTTNRTWVNGIPISHLVDAASTKGFIGLQLHANNPTDPPGGNQVRFRNIRIKTTNIKPAPLDDIFVVNMIPNHLSSQERKNGYVLLWDGKTGKGWRDLYTSSFPKAGWQIKGNELTAVPSSSEQNASDKHLMTKKQFSAFILKFDFKLSRGSNSGVRYFVTVDKKNKSASIESSGFAPEYQIIDDSIQGITANRTLGSFTDLIAARKTGNAIKRIGEWNQGLIKVLPDNKVEYWLNGYKILEYNRASADYLRLLANSQYKDLPAFGKASKGYILLEGGAGEVSFRSIKIKALKID
jgi:hypothetical protein